MRPNQLVYPFESEEEKSIKIEDRVLYFPAPSPNMSKFCFHDLEYFGNENPIYVEYCSGNGGWIAEKAIQDKNINWIGVEIKFKRIKKIWAKIKNYSLNNLIALYGEAEKSTEFLFKEASVSQAYINFPDPWPKKRHAKNRLMQENFIKELYRILKPEGSFTFVTDDEAYSNQTIELSLAHGGFKSIYEKPFYLSNPEDYGSSFFDSLWREKGKTIRLHTFQKI